MTMGKRQQGHPDKPSPRARTTNYDWLTLNLSAFVNHHACESHRRNCRSAYLIARKARPFSSVIASRRDSHHVFPKDRVAAEFKMAERAHRLDVVECFLGTRIGQV